MKQQVMIAPRKIIFRDIPIPEVEKNEVLVKMMRIGICGSDIHVYHGKHPLTPYPVTQGHEVSGVIEKVGNNIKHLKLGDMITVQPQIFCGRCHPCTHGKYHICDELKVMGFQTTGMASEYYVAEAERVLKLPATMSFEEGAMVEPVAVACGAISKVDYIKGMNVIVLGAGPIGNFVGQTVKALGANSVFITDVSEFRLKIARKVGIDYTINPMKQNLSEEIVKVFGKEKADLIFECVGSNVTINDAIENARKGTDIIIVGVFSDKPTIDLATIQDHELRLIGTLMYQTKDFLQAIELIYSEKVQLKPLISNHFPFEDYDKAYQFIEEKKDQVMKVLIDIN